jgi:hypothetical protein
MFWVWQFGQSEPHYVVPSFAPLREGLNVSKDTDVIHYFQEVFKIRERIENDDESD